MSETCARMCVPVSGDARRRRRPRMTQMTAFDGRTMHAVAASIRAMRIRLRRQPRARSRTRPLAPSHGQNDSARAVNAVSSELLKVRAVMNALARDSTVQASCDISTGLRRLTHCSPIAFEPTAGRAENDAGEPPCRPVVRRRDQALRHSRKGQLRDTQSCRTSARRTTSAGRSPSAFANANAGT